VADTDEIDASFVNLACRPDYSMSANEGTYNRERYGKSYNFVRTQLNETDDGYALYDGLFDNASILFAEAYGKSTHLKSEGFLDNSRFRWAGSCYAKGVGATVTILKSPHYTERAALKNAGTIANTVLVAETVPGFAKRQKMSFGSVLPGEAAVVSEESNTYYTPSLHNKYQVESVTNDDTKADINCVINSGAVGTLSLPSLRTFRLESVEPASEDGKHGTLSDPRAWMSDQNQRNYWAHIQFFGTRTYTSGVTKAEAEEDVEAPSERQLFANRDISPLN
jgi:hypothetical protein